MRGDFTDCELAANLCDRCAGPLHTVARGDRGGARRCLADAFDQFLCVHHKIVANLCDRCVGPLRTVAREGRGGAHRGFMSAKAFSMTIDSTTIDKRLLFLQRIVNPLGHGFRHRRDGGELFDGCTADALDGTEGSKQQPLSSGADAGDFFDD